MAISARSIIRPGAARGDARLGARLALFAALAGLAVPVIAIGATGTTVTDILKTPDEAAADGAALAERIRAEIVSLPKSASVEDLEASIMFVLSQEEADASVIGDALDILKEDKDATDARKQAIANIRLALLKKKLKTGTGAIIPGGGRGFGSGFSSIPSIGGAGGADYSS